MKTRILALIATTALAPMTAWAELDASQWQSAELIYNEEYDTHIAVPVLGDDPFQERLVWIDERGEYLSEAMLKHMAMIEEQREFRNQLVWSNFHGDYLPRFALEPCLAIADVDAPVQVAGLF